MNKTLKEVRKFNNDIKTFEERKDFIETLYQDKEVLEEAMHNDKIAKTIEEQATYLLNSSDVSSGRKIEESYYRDEVDYRSNYPIGNKTISTDIEQREDIHQTTNHIDEMFNEDSRFDDMFCLLNMTTEEKKKLIKVGLKEKDNKDSTLQEVMQRLYDEIMSKLTDEIDKKIVELIHFDISMDSISDELNINKRNVYKRFERICEKKI